MPPLCSGTLIPAMRIMQVSVVIIGIIAAPMAFSRPTNVTEMLWTAAGTIMSAVAGPVIVGLYSKRASAAAAVLGSVVGVVVYSILFFGKIIGSVYLCCGIGGLVSVALTFLGVYIFKPMDKTQADRIFSNLESED